MLERETNPRVAQDASRRADAAYARAEALAQAQNAPNLFYPVLNRLACVLAQPAGQALDVAMVARARLSAQRQVSEAPDFWGVVGLIEIDAFEAASQGRLHAAIGSLLARLEDLRVRVPAPKSWRSVHDNAEYALRGRVDGAAGAEQQALKDWLDRLAGLAGG
jgi:hypothetical protein